MDDQDWAELDAAMDDPGRTPDEPTAPSDTEQDLSLQGETRTPDTELAAEQQTAQPVTDAPEPTEAIPADVAAKIAELEKQLAERTAAEQQRQAELDEKVRQFKEQETQKLIREDQEAAQEFLEELKQTDPEWAAKFEDRRNFLAYQAEQAQREAQGSFSALDAMTLAVEYHAPELVQKIVQEAYALTQYPSPEQKRQLIAARRQAVQGESAQLAQLRQQVQELQNRLEARERPLAADVVEGGQTGRGNSFQQQWDDATDFDQAFALIS